MESKSLAILVIDENRIRASIIEAGLRETGHDRVTVVHDINGVARTIADINPDVIVIDLENPNRDVLESMFQLSRAVKRPIAMFVDRSDRASRSSPSMPRFRRSRMTDRAISTSAPSPASTGGATTGCNPFNGRGQGPAPRQRRASSRAAASTPATARRASLRFGRRRRGQSMTPFPSC